MIFGLRIACLVLLSPLIIAVIGLGIAGWLVRNVCDALASLAIFCVTGENHWVKP